MYNTPTYRALCGNSKKTRHISCDGKWGEGGNGKSRNSQSRYNYIPYGMKFQNNGAIIESCNGRSTSYVWGGVADQMFYIKLYSQFLL